MGSWGPRDHTQRAAPQLTGPSVGVRFMNVHSISLVCTLNVEYSIVVVERLGNVEQLAMPVHSVSETTVNEISLLHS